ncbi:multidrug transporter subunit MdtA [Acinetobacter sp. ANC 4558]|uniref:efflux RND transporter periplasmic adaptor subunit n=1 Tax=Acinetobacter sp. ANC 4558 TaxID=1977876 RepID=UPI000A33B257|nr:efflux RND transporter periplasmic adaptor subunit [Acinetobacter sp. ANC 4558]OTG87637.1 multidrug transporter subunit MdtA [Acinetobacter sp. ANC 4558]
MSSQPENLNRQNYSLATKSKYLIGLIILLVLGGGSWYWFTASSKPTEAQFSQWSKPVPVRVVPVERRDLNVELKAIGTIVPAHTVNVQSQVSGVLQQVYFNEGDVVNKGQLLAQIDAAPFQVALAQAQGIQQQNLAQLRNAEVELARYQLLFSQDSIAKQQVEQQQALVNQLKGQTQANQAQVNAAKLQLSYTKIYSPITGRIGFKQKDVGNLIQANEDNGLVTITQINPIYAQFSIAENYLDPIRSAMRKGEKLQVSAWDKTEQKQLAVGVVKSLDNQIDIKTGTLKLKAVFDNHNDALFPNQFVNIVLSVHTLPNALMIPNDAIQHGAKGTYVYVINKENKAEVRMLKTGVTSQGKIEILSGLTGNEQVVLEGIDRLSEGREAQIVPENKQAISTSQDAQ